MSIALVVVARLLRLPTLTLLNSVHVLHQSQPGVAKDVQPTPKSFSWVRFTRHYLALSS